MHIYDVSPKNKAALLLIASVWIVYMKLALGDVEVILQVYIYM